MSIRHSLQRMRGVRYAFAVAPIGAVIVLGMAPPARAQEASVRLSVELPEGPSTGARLFVQKGCARCHSIGGGGSQIGPDLGGVVFPGSVLELASAFWNHAPVMRAKMQELGIRHPSVTVAEMANLVSLLTAFRYYDVRMHVSGDSARGREVFVGKGCASCHEGPASWKTPGPNLQKYHGRYAPIFLAQSMWNHSSRMTSAMRARGVEWPTVTGQQMADLTAYLQVGSTAGGAEPSYFEPGSPKRGQALFAEKHCSACHSIAGKGGKGGPELGTRGRELARSVPDIASLMWNHRQQMEAEFARRRIPFVTFEGQEMADVIAYLYFVNYSHVTGVPEQGGRVFARHCSTCHGAGQGGPDLTTVPDLNTPIAIIAAMWNHASRMEDRARQAGLPWPRLETGDAANLVAFLIASRRSKGPSSSR